MEADGTVTFRYLAPKAATVDLDLEALPSPAHMTRDGNGLWTFRIKLPPQYYGYQFLVDGVATSDPLNPDTVPNLISSGSSVHVPGHPPSEWDRRDIPHGVVHHHLYRSPLAAHSDPGLSADRDFYVYTPPGYDPRSARLYPVLYLLHGYSDDASAWTAVGHADLMLDSLIFEGRIVPMIVVMPVGYGTMEMLQHGWGMWDTVPGLPMRNQRQFEDQLLHEVMPMAETHYNIARDPAHRALAGLSMGGGESLFTGLNHPDVFGYIGAFSSAIFTKDETDFAGMTRAPLHLLWISCGRDDSLHSSNVKFGEWAKAHVRARVVAGDTPGMHTWLVWRQNLIAFTPLLFRD